MLDGASFVHKADAENGNGNGNPDINSITVIDSASASEPASASASKDNCPSPRYGGNITGDHSDVGVPNFSDLRFLADQDLLVHANFDAGTNAEDPAAGTSIGGEEIELFMSSSMLAGSVLAANQCPDDSGPVPGGQNELLGLAVLKRDLHGAVA